MRKILKDEAIAIRAGAYYKCKYCRYTTDSFPAFRNHLWAWHQIRYEDL